MCYNFAVRNLILRFPDIYIHVLNFAYRCITDGKYQQAIGMAIECRRLDKLEEAVLRSENVHSTINYCIDVSHSFVNRREYRQEVTPFSITYNCYPWTCAYLLEL